MSRPALIGIACLLVLSLAPCLSYAVPTVNDKESARNLFVMGDEQFQGGDFEAALVSFTAADAIMRLPTTGLEVGRTLAKLGKLIEAREKLRKVAQLEPEDDEVSAQADARGEARAIFEALDEQIPSLQVRLRPPARRAVEEVTVHVDGLSLMAEAALLPRTVNPGTHTVRVEAAGYETEQRKVTVAAAQAFVLEIDLVVAKSSKAAIDAGQSSPMPDPSDTVRDGGSAMVPAVVLLALGGASLVVGGVMGSMTLVEADELELLCPEKRCAPAGKDHLDKAVTMSHVATATLAAGGALIVAGALTLLLSAGSEQTDGTSDTDEQAVYPLVGPGYLGVWGAF